MSHARSVSQQLPFFIVGLSLAILLVAGLAGWIRFGSSIFLSLVDSGLSYCF